VVLVKGTCYEMQRERRGRDARRGKEGVGIRSGAFIETKDVYRKRREKNKVDSEEKRKRAGPDLEERLPERATAWGKGDRGP